MLDPNSFITNAQNNFVDPSQFQNPQHQRMPNGALRNPSTSSFGSPVYNTNPLVPSKRQRQSEDNIGASPRQPPNMLPTSRSQTPQQNFNAFNGTSNPPQPTPYSHLQHNESADASPSPVMSNQLRPTGLPQRSTASPHPFSPAVQQFAPSPSHSDHTSRGDTPQAQFMQGGGFGPGYTQPFAAMQGRNGPPQQQGTLSTPQMRQMHQQQMQPPQMYSGGQPSLPGQQQSQLDQSKMMYQLQLQQQRGMMNSQVAQQQRMQMQQTANAMPKPQMPNASPYAQGMRAQQQSMPRSGNTDQFVRQLSQFMASRNQPLDMSPVVGDRNVSLIQIYMAVNKYGGYRKVNQMNAWGQIAAILQFNPMQTPAVPHQLKSHYERNLVAFEEALIMQQRQKMMQQNAGMPGHPQMSPAKSHMPTPMASQQQFIGAGGQPPNMAQQSPQMAIQAQVQNTPMKQMGHQPGQRPMTNGYGTPQPPNQAQLNAQPHARNLSRSSETPVTNGTPFAISAPMPQSKPGSLSLQAGDAPGEIPTPVDKKRKHGGYDPRVRHPLTWGGVVPAEYDGVSVELANWRPNIPSVPELGVIDIHALTMSIQSGIHSEVRLALDTFATITVETRVTLDLRVCGDLVESIIDCAEDQLELLAENSAEVSDAMLVSSYEDVTRACRIEREGLQDVPPYGTLDYDLDRSVERLICITTILRNMSFYETNHPVLADKGVITFICTIIRYLGTRHMLVRTHANTLDLMKDLIIFLSNLAQAVQIPGKEQALCLLHFLLAFAPCPPPISSNSDKVVFAPYDPAIHRYLPPAVDSLAKLLARDEPNRTFYKKIFASDVLSSPPYDLLTRSFALAISPIPGHKQDLLRTRLMQTVDARKPHLMQGMLAAEIISNLVPGYESGVARSWLTSEDGFAQSLLMLITILSTEPPSAPARGTNASAARHAEDEALLHITLSGITVLRRLFEKSRNPEDPTSTVPTDGMIKQESLLGALMLRPPTQPRPEVLRQLCVYAKLDM